MNKRPGQLNVVTEVGYCPFCERTRNLRREDRQLGALVRTTVTCETCHRTLESSISVAGAGKPAPKKAAAPRTAAATQEPRPAKKATTATSAAGKPKAKAQAKPKATTTMRRTAKGK
jgi:hypothetical protein